MDLVYIDKCRYEIPEQKVFRYGVPTYNGPFRALDVHHNKDTNPQNVLYTKLVEIPKEVQSPYPSCP
jgi:hypothetical protein